MSSFNDWLGKRITVEIEECHPDFPRWSDRKYGRLDNVDTFGVWLKQDAIGVESAFRERMLVFYPWARVLNLRPALPGMTLEELEAQDEAIAAEERAWQQEGAHE